MYRWKFWMWFFVPFDFICWVIWLAVIFLQAATVWVSARAHADSIVLQMFGGTSSDYEYWRELVIETRSTNIAQEKDLTERYENWQRRIRINITHKKRDDRSFQWTNWLMWHRHFNGCNKSTERHLIIFHAVLQSPIQNQNAVCYSTFGHFIFKNQRHTSMWFAIYKRRDTILIGASYT